MGTLRVMAQALAVLTATDAALYAVTWARQSRRPPAARFCLEGGWIGGAMTLLTGLASAATSAACVVYTATLLAAWWWLRRRHAP